MRKIAVLLIAVCAGRFAAAAEDLPEQQLNQVRAQMGYALKTLPNYVCFQTTERLRASKAGAKLKAIDTVGLEVAHVDGGEMYSWPGQSMFAESELGKKMPFGLVSSGAYSSQVIDVLFGPGNTISVDRERGVRHARDGSLGLCGAESAE